MVKISKRKAAETPKKKINKYLGLCVKKI